jgi:cytoplasmic iron level regulating protein YaaA (DUF328/UPF0246 family)
VLILLPPSETKRDGGPDDSKLDLGALSFPSLTPHRKAALASLRDISKSVAASTVALGLGPTQRFEVDRNRAIRTSAVMPAVERYTGVLYDAIDVARLDPDSRRFLGNHVVIHSALFGLIGADDPVPAYRFSHGTKLAGTSVTKLWRDANAAVLATRDELVLDLRSESYVHLGPTGPGAHFLRVVSVGPSGETRALNHFNKHGKGELVRALARAGQNFATIDELLAWAHGAGINLTLNDVGELQLVV